MLLASFCKTKVIVECITCGADYVEGERCISKKLTTRLSKYKLWVPKVAATTSNSASWVHVIQISSSDVVFWDGGPTTARSRC
jgi:hypothetical protein